MDIGPYGYTVDQFDLCQDPLFDPVRNHSYCPGGNETRTCNTTHDCFDMGITSGCYDVYWAFLPCQWIDVTDVADGDYWLTVDVNWNSAQRRHVTPENDYSNNAASIAVRLARGRTQGGYRIAEPLTNSQVTREQLLQCSRL